MRYNFVVYSEENKGFLNSYENDSPFFAPTAELAMGFKKVDANKLALKLCEKFGSMVVLKRCSTMESYSFSKRELKLMDKELKEKWDKVRKANKGN